MTTAITFKLGPRPRFAPPPKPVHPVADYFILIAETGQLQSDRDGHVYFDRDDMTKSLVQSLEDTTSAPVILEINAGVSRDITREVLAEIAADWRDDDSNDDGSISFPAWMPADIGDDENNGRAEAEYAAHEQRLDWASSR